MRSMCVCARARACERERIYSLPVYEILIILKLLLKNIDHCQIINYYRKGKSTFLKYKFCVTV